jgi:hypothetical protein
MDVTRDEVQFHAADEPPRGADQVLA